MTGRRAVAVAIGLVVLPILWNAWSAGRDGWAPEGDSASIVVRTHDVFSTDPPLLGNPTTAGQQGFRSVEDLRHPGPIEFWVLAVPLRLLGPSGAGALLGAALVGVASVAAIGWLALRRGGPVLAIWVLAGTAGLTFGLGDEVLHDVYNPHLLLLPHAVLVLSVFAAACGDRVALPVGVAAASFVAQSHALYALPALVVAVAVAVASAVHARPDRRWWLGSAALGLVLWLPPLVAELQPGPSNLAGLLQVGTGEAAGEVDRALGPDFALARLADTLIGFRWLDPDPAPLALINRPSPAVQVLAVLLVLGLVALGVRAHRTGRRVVAALVTAAVAAVAGSVVTSTRLPGGLPLLERHSHRHWWVTGAVFWVGASWAVADLLRPRLRALPTRARFGLVGVPLVVAASAVAWKPSIDGDRGSASFAAVEQLTGAVAEALPAGGPWLVTASGPQAFLSVQPGVVAGLVLRGIDVRVEPAQGEAMGAHRVVDGPVAGTILVASGRTPPRAPRGYELVARFDSPADAARTGHTATVLFDELQQVAVFLAVGETATTGGG